MGVISTYGELKTALTDYTGRGGSAAVVAALPLFCRRAHDVLMRDLTIPLLQATADVTINAERVAVPATFRAAARFAIDAAYDTPILPTSIENRLAVASARVAARPEVFAIEGSFFAFGPIPDTTYTGKLLYWQRLAFFANDAATNDLLTRYPFAYLYGALAELARFDKSDEDMAIYEAMFRSEIDTINVAEARDARLGGSLTPMPASGVAP